MKFAFIIDPLVKLKAYKDSSVFMMREAAKRGHEVFAFEAKDMALARGDVSALATRLRLNADNDNWYSIDASAETRLADFDAVLMRKDPPFNQEYLYSTQLLELAERQGARVVNRARSLRDYNEKLATARFPQFMPPTLVTQSMERIHAFIDEQRDVIV